MDPLACAGAGTGGVRLDREPSRILGAEAAALLPSYDDLGHLCVQLLAGHNAAVAQARSLQLTIESIQGLGALAKCDKGCVEYCGRHLSAEG